MIHMAKSVDLYYTLATDRRFLHGVKIFGQLHAETSFGKLEVAIIGSSHYLLIEDAMVEIISCHPANVKSASPIYHTLIREDFTYGYVFNGFTYHFSVKRNRYTTEAFVLLEQQLANEKFDLFHPFKDQSAITAIRLDRTKADFISVLTWHTYPETSTIIETITNLRLE